MYNMLEDGWSAFRPESEFSKLLVPGSNEEWRISYVNKDFMVKTHTAANPPYLKRQLFQICSSYPSAVVVPKSIDDETLIAASKFRHNGRFPVLSYKHEGGVKLSLVIYWASNLTYFPYISQFC
jgi:myotubularin-related protein 9